MTYNLEYSNEDRVLFERINQQSREAVKALKKKTAQELIDQI